jgi:diaminopimelate epimerase
MRHLTFDKYEALGNDFVVVEGAPDALSAERAVAICDRRRGVGADGVLFTGVERGRPFMRVINADGSTAEMCGNGLRCVAIHLLRCGLVTDLAFEVETASGPHPVEVIALSPPGRVAVSMRAASLAPADVPVISDQPVIDAPLAGVRLTAVSMGNPHAVLFDVERSDALAARIQIDRAFPKQVNVGFARMGDDGGIELAVYERGVGWTQACGTGACAAAVAAVESGRAPRHAPIEVRLPGGALTIIVGEPGDRVKMTGPARRVFGGSIEL